MRFVGRCLLFAGCCVLFMMCCLLVVVWCLLLAVCRLLVVCSMFAVVGVCDAARCASFAVRSWPLVVCCSFVCWSMIVVHVRYC